MLLRSMHGHPIWALSRTQSHQVTPATQDIFGGQRPVPALLLLRNWRNFTHRRKLIRFPHLYKLAKELGSSIDELVGLRSDDQCFSVLLRDSTVGLHSSDFTFNAVC